MMKGIESAQTMIPSAKELNAIRKEKFKDRVFEIIPLKHSKAKANSAPIPMIMRESRFFF